MLFSLSISCFNFGMQDPSFSPSLVGWLCELCYVEITCWLARVKNMEILLLGIGLHGCIWGFYFVLRDSGPKSFSSQILKRSTGDSCLGSFYPFPFFFIAPFAVGWHKLVLFVVQRARKVELDSHNKGLLVI